MLRGMNLENGAYRCVELCIHKYDVFTVGECLQDHTRPELHRPRDIDENVDMRASSKQHGRFCGNSLARLDSLIEDALAFCQNGTVDTGITEDFERTFGVPVGNGDHPHSWDGMSDRVSGVLDT